MRRALALVGLIAVGVLIGFLVRLVWPHRRSSVPTVYNPPGSPGTVS